MPGAEINAGLDAGPIQKMCGAGSVPGSGLGESLTSLQDTRNRVDTLWSNIGIYTYIGPQSVHTVSSVL